MFHSVLSFLLSKTKLTHLQIHIEVVFYSTIFLHTHNRIHKSKFSIFVNFLYLPLQFSFQFFPFLIFLEIYCLLNFNFCLHVVLTLGLILVLRSMFIQNENVFGLRTVMLGTRKRTDCFTNLCLQMVTCSITYLAHSICWPH